MTHTFTVKVTTGKRTKVDVDVYWLSDKPVTLPNGKTHDKGAVAVFIQKILQQEFEREAKS